MNTYRQILKTTGIVGLTQVVVIVFGVMRAKAMALLLGPSGVGLFGLYTSIADAFTSLSSFGVDKSGVQQIAKAVGVNDNEKVARCLFVIRRVILCSSLLAALFCLLFSKAISLMVFGTGDQMWGVSLIASVIFFTGISFGQRAVLNGFRDIPALSMCQVWGAIFGTMSTVLIIYFLGEDGVALSLVSVALFSILTSWWYARKITIIAVAPSRQEAIVELKQLLGIGFSFCLAGIMATISAYVIKVYLRNCFGLETVGLYQAGWTITNLYVGMVLSAMGTDFLPRISAHCHDHATLNRLMNEQMEIGVLIVSAGVVAGIIFSPVILPLLYSKDFSAGQTMMRWLFLGTGIRIIGWPLGYLLTAKGRGGIYVLIQAVFCALEVLFIIGCVKLFGFNGVGLHYYLAYVLYVGLGFYVGGRVTGLSLSPLLKKVLMTSGFFQGLAMLLVFFLSRFWATVWGAGLLLACVFWSLALLKRDMRIDGLQILFSKIRRTTHDA